MHAPPSGACLGGVWRGYTPPMKTQQKPPRPPCEAPGCIRESKEYAGGRRLCPMHRQRWRRRGQFEARCYGVHPKKKERSSQRKRALAILAAIARVRDPADRHCIDRRSLRALERRGWALITVDAVLITAEGEAALKGTKLTQQRRL